MLFGSKRDFDLLVHITRELLKDVVEQECQNSLEWYNDHPGYKGEFVRVFEYCKKTCKRCKSQGI